MTPIYGNFGVATLAVTVDSLATTFVLPTGEGARFPNPSAGQFFALSLTDAATRQNHEICYCTARAGDVLTVTRGEEGTTAQSWLVGDQMAATNTAGLMGLLASTIAVADAFSAAFPVGSIYLTAGNSAPTFISGATWTQISQGRALVGVGTGTDINAQTQTFAAGNDAVGEYKHPLIEAENGQHSHNPLGNPLGGAFYGAGTGASANLAATGVFGNIMTSTDPSGSGDAHNTIQPSFGIYVWKRTA